MSQQIKYTVARDTREQLGWTFPVSDQCLGTVNATLKSGDYTLEGYEEIFAIERKRSSGEFAQNVVQKRFEKELKRLESLEHSFVVLEFNLEDIITYPKNSGIPIKIWNRLQLTPQFFLKRLHELQIEYKTEFIFAGNYGREFCSSLFKRMVEKYGISTDK